MTCRLTGAKSLSEPMLQYCKLNPLEQPSVNFNRNLYIFIQENAFQIVVRELAAILSRPLCVNVDILLPTMVLIFYRHLARKL